MPRKSSKKLTGPITRLATRRQDLQDTLNRIKTLSNLECSLIVTFMVSKDKARVSSQLHVTSQQIAAELEKYNKILQLLG